MHIVLVGPGALGGLIACFCNKGMSSGDRLTILDHRPERAALLATGGITYCLDDTEHHFAVAASSDPFAIDPADVLLICVKSYDVEATVAFCQPLLSENTLVVFFQNGISHLTMAEKLAPATAAFATTTEGATLLAPGRIRHAGSGTTFLGFLTEQGDRQLAVLNRFQELLASGGLDVHSSANILARLWAKLFINVGINALTAVLGCKNGELLTIPGVENRMRDAVEEAAHIARENGIQMMNDPFRATRIVCSKTAENISSMLQDVRRKKRTEIDAINGAISFLGRRLDIPTQENDRLCDEIRAIEANYTTT
jgi:2-dehydropantoate 2-reductase